MNIYYSQHIKYQVLRVKVRINFVLINTSFNELLEILKMITDSGSGKLIFIFDIG